MADMALNLEPARNGRWTKGQSGNPKGRATNVTAQELARVYTEDAIKALVIALRYPKERVPAATALLDRAWGKPQINVHTQSESTVLHLIAAQALGVELQQSIQTVVATERPVIEASLDEPAKE